MVSLDNDIVVGAKLAESLTIVVFCQTSYNCQAVFTPSLVLGMQTHHSFDVRDKLIDWLKFLNKKKQIH